MLLRSAFLLLLILLSLLLMLLLLGGSESVQEFLRWRHLLLQIGTCVLRDIDLDCVPVAIVATEVHSQIQVLGRGLLLLD